MHKGFLHSWTIGLLVALSGCASNNIPPSTTLEDAPIQVKPDQEVPPVQPVPTKELTPPEQARELTLVGVGDIMLGTDFPKNLLPENNGLDLLQSVLPVLQQADITFGNFEGTFLDGGVPRKTCKSLEHCFLFRTPTSYVNVLKGAGFSAMSLANNHSVDFGEIGRSTSMQVLTNAGIRHSGRENDIASWNVQGLNVAMIAYAPFVGSNNPHLYDQVKQTIASLKASHDLVIVSMHLGAEGEKALRLPFKREIFFGEDRGDSVEFSHMVIDAGADLVLGHGPHVPRALELYKDRLIAYSLGNFCTYLGINVNGKTGLAPLLKVRLAKDGRFLDGQIISARQIRPAGPVLDDSHEAARLMQQLTDLDFPKTDLLVGKDGMLSRKSQRQSIAPVSRIDNSSQPHRFPSTTDPPVKP